MTRKLRYLTNDFPAKFAMTLHLMAQGHSDISGFDEEAFKGFEIRQGRKQFEVMRASDWEQGSFPFSIYQIFSRKTPDKYESDPECEQFYSMFRNDWQLMQVIRADVEWQLKPCGEFAFADPSQSWTVEVNPLAASITRALEAWGWQCLEYNNRVAFAV
jgi:hypothetical protein